MVGELFMQWREVRGGRCRRTLLYIEKVEELEIELEIEVGDEEENAARFLSIDICPRHPESGKFVKYAREHSFLYILKDGLEVYKGYDIIEAYEALQQVIFDGCQRLEITISKE